MLHTRDSIGRDLEAIGARSGDVLLLRAALRALGRTEGRQADTIIDAALDVLGPAGTLVGLAFSRNVFRFDRNGSPTFSRESPVTSGGFAAAMLERPGARRSGHPTNSFVALGARAVDVLAGHDHSATSFFPIQQMLELDGKMAIVGCIASSPGFSTVHRAQENLGLATKTLLRGLFGAYYDDCGKRRWFSRLDVAGCSMGFGHFYSEYLAAEQLRVGRVGDAYSAFITCRAAYAIEERVLRGNPRLALCNRADCISCRGTRFYNLRDVPGIVARTIVSPRVLLGKLKG